MQNTYDIGIILCYFKTKTSFDKDDFIKHFNAKLVDSNFAYNSGKNEKLGNNRIFKRIN